MPGEVLDLNKIQKELNLSRTPVRDAISALEQENLVTVLPRRGVLVTSITLKGISDIYEVREQLEPYIARKAVLSADKERLLYFKNMFSSADTGAENFTALDYEFHLYLVNTLNNPYLSSVMDRVLSHNMRFIILGSKIPQRLEHSNNEHLRILDALLEGNEELAEKMMKEHMIYARESAFRSMTLGTISLS